MNTYSASHTWFPTPTTAKRLTISDCESQENANFGIRRWVLESKDYTPPRWWQYWRWKEERLPDQLKGNP